MVICLERADATATPSSLGALKSKFIYPFWCQLTQVVLQKENILIKWLYVVAGREIKGIEMWNVWCIKYSAAISSNRRL